MAFFESDSEDHWIPLADVMTGLMLIFLLITVYYVIKFKQETIKLQRHEIAAQESQPSAQIRMQLYHSLQAEFASDLVPWQATIESYNLSVNFKAPNLLFKTGQANLQAEFITTLDDFFPRYLKILYQYQNSIAEIRIDGYASNIWGNLHDPDEIYLRNMQLSQQRSMNVLYYLHQITADAADKQYLREYFTANGFSSSQLITANDGSEDLAKSQRVEFKIILRKSS